MQFNEVLPYIHLISSFVEGKISANEFESQYLKLYKNDPTPWSEELFSVLDGLFADVDAFCPDPDLRDEGDLDEDQLRQRSAAALEKLRSLLSKTESL